MEYIIQNRNAKTQNRVWFLERLEKVLKSVFNVYKSEESESAEQPGTLMMAAEQLGTAYS